MGMYPEAEAKPEHILCAAIYINDEKYHDHQPRNVQEGFVVAGRRHHNCFQTLSMIDIPWKDYEHIQGFLTSKDRFLTRESAASLARSAKQITSDTDTLFSEDLY